MNKLPLALAGAILFNLATPKPAAAWDYDGHRLVNQLALASLPKDFPAFVHEPAAEERVAFLAGEPDRWRNTPDMPLKHLNEPDHYLDVEDLQAYRLDPKALSHFRYEFVGQVAVARAQHPENFPALDPTKDPGHHRHLPGFLPWAITENYAKLKSGFSSLKVFEELGTPDEITNARADILYVMGVLGHYVGDAAQPLHTTRHYNGWVGDNPKGYTTSNGFHSWIDGGYLGKVGVKFSELRPQLREARLLWPVQEKMKQEEVFPVAMDYILGQFKKLEPLYQLDKDGRLSGQGEKGLEGKAFLAGQLTLAGQMLGDLWYSAWHQAPVDTYLRRALNARKLNAQAKP